MGSRHEGPPSRGGATGADAPAVTIGMMRAGDSATGPVALAAAHAAHMQGAGFFVFTPGDVDLARRTIRAQSFDGREWRAVSAAFPDVIDNDDVVPGSAVWPALTAGRPFTMNSLGGKAEVARRIEAAAFYPDLQIPTRLVGEPADVLDAVAAFGRAVVKPARGAKGGDVHLIRREGTGYAVDLRGTLRRLAASEFPQFCAERFGSGRYVSQRYIESRTAQDLPFDVRIHARRDRAAKWRVVKTYVRIGGGLGIASNLAAGGSVASARDFLRIRFGERWEPVWKSLVTLGRDMPRRFQALYPEFTIDALGFDLGLDADGKPWLYEVNCYPGARHFALEAAVLRIGYAIRLARSFRAQPAGDRPAALVRAG